MKRKISAVLVFVLLLCIMVLPSGATQNTYRKIDVMNTEFGPVEVETALTIQESLARSNTKRASAAQTFKFSGKVIAEVTLSATFGYDGKTAWVVSASGSHTTYDGWKYGGEKITKSGGTATLTATLSKLTSSNIPVNISLTCSPTGEIS